MNNQVSDPERKSTSLYEQLRNNILPLKPTDSASGRVLKQSAFYLFLVMLVLITGVVALAITFVL
ncbi:hypothetical protein D3H65_30980 [Paraflavitalea soli]|uniref:Uncharacterized protein n=1 Tax=Paraflavitalea soli TaxID=2315862 RepID=A0A3B7MUE6_9BACT|nr:hypothetical protein [Paraflavitalea soli]AXY78152.1 hypothetical protein D3H65_30980 [Paraflavitalea soli]